MKRILFLLIPVFALLGCMSAGKINYSVRIDHFEGREAIALVHMQLNPFENWNDTPHRAPPIGLARQLLRLELQRRGGFNYSESSTKVVPGEGNTYEIIFRLKGDDEKFTALLGVNMIGDISSRKN